VLQALAPPNSAASGINSRGQVAGTSDGRAFLYADGARRDLGTLGGARSSAKGLNDSGQVVGMASDANAQPRSFVFDGAMRALGPAYSGAVAINNRGQVVGSAEGTHGYLVDGDTYTRLDTLSAVTAKGWRHMEPTGINDHGWIVGTGSNAAGELRAFILVPARATRDDSRGELGEREHRHRDDRERPERKSAARKQEPQRLPERDRDGEEPRPLREVVGEGERDGAHDGNAHGE
jgi:probable HAF family extracellular repeat protein